MDRPEVSRREIGRFLVDEFLNGATEEAALAWFDWFAEQGLALVSYNNEGVQGLAVFRPVLEIPGEDDHYTVDESGSIFWIELLIWKSTEDRRFFWRYFADRFNAAQFETVAWRRRKHGGRVTATKFKNFYRKMLKENS